MKGRETATKIGNVTALWSAPWSLTVMGLDLTATMSVANNPRLILARTAQQTMTALVLLFVAAMTSNAGKNVQARDVAART